MPTIIIDVREPFEYAAGHVDGAINIPPATLMDGLPSQLKDKPKDTELVLYCLSGARSSTSAKLLTRYGFTNIVNGINQYHVEATYGDGR